MSTARYEHPDTASSPTQRRERGTTAVTGEGGASGAGAESGSNRARMIPATGAPGGAGHDLLPCSRPAGRPRIRVADPHVQEPPAIFDRLQPAPRAGALRARLGAPLLLGLLRTARPKQWIKNVLVFTAPGAAGVLGHRVALVHTLLAAAVFCLAASGIYCINDATDVEADRIHPDKRLRPVAAGLVPV
ncbi:MAG TPA: hypothetical protein VGP96_07550, partial [Candidatus Dormibacteraeota bacterium]|nr:hypothetical protein [Candidatus Dormibacteraeota bacterium]